MSPALTRWPRRKLPAFCDRLTRRLVWDLPGFFSGRDETIILREITDQEIRLELRAAGAGSAFPAIAKMQGDFFTIRSRLAAARAAHRERPPAAPAGEARDTRNAIQLRLALTRASEYEISAGATAAKLLRFEALDWRWSSGPYGQAPGSAPRLLPSSGKVEAPDAPLVLAAPLAAFLLARLYQSGALSAEEITPLSATQAFDDEGFAPQADGRVTRRSLLEPWPERIPGALTWAGDAAPAPLEKLSASFLAFSFAAFDCDRSHFSWALPLYACRDGKAVGSAGLHQLSGRVRELLNALQGRGRSRAAWGLAPRCESPALVLRPLSKLRGRLTAVSFQSASDPSPGLRDAEAFIRALR